MTIAIIYNADGHRIRKSVTMDGNTTNTYYLVDEQTPTGYAQVLEEWVEVVGVSSTRKFYTYGLDLISQRAESGATNYFGYDGHGSVRFLTGSGTNATDTYTFDAYGTLIARTGTTPNHFLYAGEQFDEDLGQYYLRARYFNPETGRFLTMDSYEGCCGNPASLHKYGYGNSNPINLIDPSGNSPILDILFTLTENFHARGSKEKQTVTTVRRVNKKLCSVGAKLAGPYGKLRPKLEELNRKLEKAGLPQFQKHHILQDARMLSEFARDGYTTGLGFALPLLGGNSWPGSPHRLATASQISTKNESIAAAAKTALIAAGCSSKDADRLTDAAMAHVAFLGIKNKVLGK
jgi:RHS repeat-associated protein